jgi:hypothetical protein
MTCGSFGLDALPTPVERSLPELIASMTTDSRLRIMRFAVG